MIFAISDIHGHYDLLEKRVGQIKPFLKEENNKLIFLGDYIDRGDKSYQCLQFIYNLEKKYGREKVIVLKGNHELWFEEFLFEKEDIWLEEDRDFVTSGTFLSEGQFEGLNCKSNRETKIDFVKKSIIENHKSLLSWMRNLRLYYITDNQIFVHGGVDENVTEEEVEWCVIGTPDYVLTGKFIPSTGPFYKDVIAGHIAASFVARDRELKGIYFDGYSHFFIDGSVEKNKRLLCLVYDEKNKKYYEFNEDGSFVRL